MENANSKESTILGLKEIDDLLHEPFVDFFKRRIKSNRLEKAVITRFMNACEIILNQPAERITVQQLTETPKSKFYIKGTSVPTKSFRYAQRCLKSYGFDFKYD